MLFELVNDFLYVFCNNWINVVLNFLLNSVYIMGFNVLLIVGNMSKMLCKLLRIFFEILGGFNRFMFYRLISKKIKKGN